MIFTGNLRFVRLAWVNSNAIIGKAKATAGQMEAYLKKKNPAAAPFVLDMIPLYLSEGEAEGVRGDIAFAQSCLETGNFTFSGSAVTLGQNNFCGLGVTQRGKNFWQSHPMCADTHTARTWKNQG